MKVLLTILTGIAIVIYYIKPFKQPTLTTELVNLPEIPIVVNLETYDHPVQQQFKQRYKYIQLVNKNHPTDEKKAWAIGQLCKTFHAYQMLDYARDCYLNAIAIDRNIEWLYLLAHVFNINGEKNKALAYFEQVLTLQDHIPTKIWLAQLLTDMNQLENASEIYQSVLEIQTQHPMALYGQALIKRSMQQPEIAIENLLQVLKSQPNAYQVHYQLGQIYVQLNQMENANKHLSKVVDDAMSRISIEFEDPLMQTVSDLRRSAQSEVRRGRKALAQKQYKLAIRLFEKAVAANSDRIDTLYNLALALFLSGRHNQAENVLLQLLEKNDKHHLTYRLMSKIHQKQNKLESAQKYMQRAQQLKNEKTTEKNNEQL